MTGDKPFIWYALVDGVPIPVEVTDVRRRISDFHLETDCGSVRVSTIFLSLDHNFSPHGPPILFETMVFPNLDSDYADWFRDVYCARYSSMEQARAGHALVVARAEAGEWVNWRKDQ